VAKKQTNQADEESELEESDLESEEEEVLEYIKNEAVKFKSS
jgi:hypothetical protein